MDEIIQPGYNKGNNIGTDARIMDDINRLEGAKDKINITTPDKTNKSPILINY